MPQNFTALHIPFFVQSLSVKHLQMTATEADEKTGNWRSVPVIT